MKLNPLHIDFTHNNQAHRLVLKRYGYTLQRQEALTVWEGALVFADMGISPTTYRDTAATPELIKAALLAVKALSKREKLKVARRGVDALVRDLGATWSQNLEIRNKLGVL